MTLLWAMALVEMTGRQFTLSLECLGVSVHATVHSIFFMSSSDTDSPFPISGTDLVRCVWHEFGYVEYRKAVRIMEGGMCDPVDKRRAQCTKDEANKEREVGADYMRDRHGLVESREPAYRPVKGGKKKGKY